MSLDYANAIGASGEVIWWISTVLEAKKKKTNSGLDQGEVEHIIDYLASAAAPKRLRKMSYTQARESSIKWNKANQKKGRLIVDGDDDVETIHDFLDGTRIVKLKTKKAYQREGTLMAHCVGGYAPDTTTIYSYRDKNNNPHATFQVEKSGKQIVQIKGKGNGSIHPKYIHPILTFLKTIGLDIRPNDMINLGYQHVSQDMEDMLRRFVDKNGNGPEILSLFGNKYVVVSR